MLPLFYWNAKQEKEKKKKEKEKKTLQPFLTSVYLHVLTPLAAHWFSPAVDLFPLVNYSKNCPASAIEEGESGRKLGNLSTQT